MKYLMIFMMLLPLGLQGQDTIPAVDTILPDDVIFYSHSTITDTIFNPEDSTTTYEKRLVRERVMSLAEYKNLVRYHTRKISKWEERINDLAAEIELAEEALEAAGESKELAGELISLMEDHKGNLAYHKDELAVLGQTEDQVILNYEAGADKKLQKLKKIKKEKDKAELEKLTKAELEAILEDNGLSTSGNKAELVQRIIDNGLE